MKRSNGPPYLVLDDDGHTLRFATRAANPPRRWGMLAAMLLVGTLAWLAPGCAGTPTACTDCDPKGDVGTKIPPGTDVAAAAEGGQRAESNPRIEERVRVNPFVFRGSGHDGDTNPTITNTERRSLAGAPAVTQAGTGGPTAAMAGGGMSPQVDSEREWQADLRAQLMAERDPTERARLFQEMRESLRRMGAASIPTPNVTYAPNQKVVNVAIGRSTSGGGGTDPAEREAQAREAEALAKAGADVAGKVMGALETPAPAVPPSPGPEGTIPEKPAVEKAAPKGEQPAPPAGPVPPSPAEQPK